jgi:DNA-binding transcriptional ArsR family regulator
VRHFINAAKALGDTNRVRVLLALRGRELCVCQIVELLELAPSTVSKHMSILKQAYLVESRKSGRWVHYRRAENGIPPAARDALNWVDASLAGEVGTRQDTKRLKKILKIPVEELCTLRTQS